MKTTWILVADSSRARIFTADKPSSPLTELETIAHPEGRMHERDMTSDLPGHHADSVGGGRHGFDDETEPKEQETIDFAKLISRHLEAARTTNNLEQLMIVAPPSFLGNIRNELSEQARKLVTVEVNKNLVRHSPEDIRKHLPEYLPRP